MPKERSYLKASQIQYFSSWKITISHCKIILIGIFFVINYRKLSGLTQKKRSYLQKTRYGGVLN